MLKLLAMVVMAYFLSGPACADSFRLKSQDKQLHIMSGYGLSLTSTLLLEHKLDLPRWQAVLIASAFTMAVGTAKEFIVDEHYSAGDQWANLIGTAGSAAMVFTFEF